MNTAIIMGRLTAAPELRQTQNGGYVTSFTIAINRGKDQNGNDRGADFPNVVAFGKTAETICKYFTKGDGICVETAIHTGSYTDSKHPDVKHYTTDFWVTKLHFIPKPAQQQNRSNQSNNYQQGYQQGQNNGYQQNNLQNMPDFDEVIGGNDLPF